VSGRLAVFAAAGLSALAFAISRSSRRPVRDPRGVTMALPCGWRWPCRWRCTRSRRALPRVSAGVRAVAFGALCAAHAVVAVFTAVLVASVADVPVIEALGEASLSFLPAPLLQLLAVPLILLPLRPLLPRARRAQVRRTEGELEWARPRAETVPGWQGGRPATGLSPVAAEPSVRETGAGRPGPAGVSGARSSVFSAPPKTMAPVPAPVAAEPPSAPVASPAPATAALRVVRRRGASRAGAAARGAGRHAGHRAGGTARSRRHPPPHGAPDRFAASPQGHRPGDAVRGRGRCERCREERPAPGLPMAPEADPPSRRARGARHAARSEGDHRDSVRSRRRRAAG
jgi:hypothetical protein